MQLYKRCACRRPATCPHPLWYKFQFQGRRYRSSTRTRTKALAQRIAARARERLVAAHFGVAS